MIDEGDEDHYDELELEKEPETQSIRCNSPKLEVQSEVNNQPVAEISLENQFRIACLSGAYERVRELLSSNVNVNTRDNNFKTPLHYAAELGDLKLCKLLVNHKAFKNSKDACGRTPLLCAAIRGRLDVIQYLIQEGVFTFVVDEDGNGILHLVALNGHLSALDWLVENCDLDLDLPNSHGKTYKQVSKKGLESLDEPKKNILPTPITLTPSVPSTSDALKESKKSSPDLLVTQSSEALINACYAGDFQVAIRLIPVANVNCVHESSLTPLHFACHAGQCQLAQALLEAGADPNVQDRKGLTPLHYSCQNRNIELIDTLFRFKADFISDDRGYSPLHLSALSGDVDIFRLLISHGGNINDIDHQGNSSFFYILEAKCLDLAIWVIENCHPDLYLANFEGVTPLDFARNAGLVDFCSLAVEAKSKYELHLKSEKNTQNLFSFLERGNWKEAEEIMSLPLYVDKLSELGYSALHLCSREGNLSCVKTLLSLGANINGVDKDAKTPLMHACQHGHVSIVTLLLSNGCDLNLVDMKGWSAFYFAVSSNHLPIAKMLYGFGIQLNRDSVQNTLLHVACQTHSTQTLQWLVEDVGLSIHESLVNNFGETAIGIAQKNNFSDILNFSQEILEREQFDNTINFLTALTSAQSKEALALLKLPTGVNPNYINEEGRVVFHLACEYGNIDIVKGLLEQGASINLEDPGGRNAMHCACGKGQLEIIRWLKKIGSSLDQPSKTGLTPLHYACLSGSIPVVRWLIDRGANPANHSSDSSTVLHFASASGNRELVNWLHSDYHMDFNLLNAGGLRPIDFAAKEGEVELVLWLSRKNPLPDSELTSLRSKAATIRKQKLLRRYELQIIDGAMIGDTNKIQNALDFGIDPNFCGIEGLNPLHLACSENKMNAVTFLIEKNAIVDFPSVDGLTPLHLSAKRGHSQILEYLIKQKANIKQLDNDGNDILIYASASQTPDLAKSIVEKYPAFNEFRRNRLGVCAVVAAARAGNSDLVQWFLDNPWFQRQNKRFFEALTVGAVEVIEEFLNSGIDLNTVGNCGLSPLHIVSESGLYSLVQKFIHFGANENFTDSSFRTSLHFASQKGHTEIVKYLCDLRVDIDPIDDLGMTPLLYACQEGHILTVAYLVGQGANILACNIEESNALHLACRTGELGLVQWLCEGFNISEEKVNIFSKTPRDIAFESGRANIVSYLEGRRQIRIFEEAQKQKEKEHLEDERKRIEAELELKWLEERTRAQMIEKELFEKEREEEEIQLRTKELLEATAIQQMFEFSRSGNAVQLQELLSYGTNPNASDKNDNWTALHYASQYGHVDVINILTDAGANVNQLTAMFETPLLIAAKYHQESRCLWALLKKGAVIDICASNNMTPLHYICENGSGELFAEIFYSGLKIKSSLAEDLLRISAKNNRVTILQSILQMDVDIDAEDSSQKTALHYACESACTESVKFLLSVGAAVDVCDQNGKTPLIYGIQSNSYDIVVLLLDHRASVFDVDVDGNTPLHFACRCEDHQIGNLLIQHGADIYSTNVAAETPSQIAMLFNKSLAISIKKAIERTNEILDVCSNGDLEWINFMLAKKSDLGCRDKNRVCGLHVAAENGHIEICQSLIQSGLHVDTDDKFGRTAIFYACAAGHLEVVKFLVARGSDLRRLSADFRSCLHAAVRSNSVAIIHWLIDNGLDCCHVSDDHSTPLHDAAAHNCIQSAKVLLERGASVNALTVNGLTSFHVACLHDHFEFAELLLTHGCEIDTKDEHEFTSFLQACQDNRFEMVEWLYSQGSNIYVCGGRVDKFDTALHISTRNGNLRISEWLLSKGLDQYAPNSKNITPVDLARENGLVELISLMKDDRYGIYSRIETLTRELELALLKKNKKLIESVFEPTYTLYLHNIRASLTQFFLFCAAGSIGRVDILETLLSEGANPDYLSPTTGMAPLHYACQHGQFLVVNFLIEKGAKLLIADIQNRTPLDIAVAFGCDEIVELFLHLESSRKRESDEDKVDETIAGACIAGDFGRIKSLVESLSGDIVNSVDNPAHRSPLQFCILENPDEEIINYLLSHGADPNLIDHEGMSSLHHACQLKLKPQIILSLIKQKGQLNLPNKSGETPLHLICRNNLVELMEDVLSLPRSVLKNLNLNVLDGEGRNLLHLAIEAESLKMVSLLLHQGVHINHGDKFESTPLHIAVQNGLLEITQLLLSKGAEPNRQDILGRTPLSLSILHLKNVNFARLLFDHGGKLNQKFENGDTFLHIACRNGNVELAKWLVRSGLNPSDENSKGATAVELAHLCGQEDLLEWLLAWIVAVKVGRPVEEILAEATGTSVLMESSPTAEMNNSSKLSDIVNVVSDESNALANLQGSPSKTRRTNRQIALL